MDIPQKTETERDGGGNCTSDRSAVKATRGGGLSTTSLPYLSTVSCQTGRARSCRSPRGKGWAGQQEMPAPVNCPGILHEGLPLGVVEDVVALVQLGSRHLAGLAERAGRCGGDSQRGGTGFDDAAAAAQATKRLPAPGTRKRSRCAGGGRAPRGWLSCRLQGCRAGGASLSPRAPHPPPLPSLRY